MAIEWIDRREQEPDRKQDILIYYNEDEEIIKVYCGTDDQWRECREEVPSNRGFPLDENCFIYWSELNYPGE